MMTIGGRDLALRFLVYFVDIYRRVVDVGSGQDESRLEAHRA